MTRSVNMLVENAVRRGEIRCAVAPIDLLRAIGSVASAPGAPHGRKNATALIDVLVAGMRTRR